MEVLNVVKPGRFVFPLACLAAVAMLVISEGSYWRAVAAMKQISAMQTAQVSIVGLSQSVLDAETGQRGYLLSNRKEYLLPYQTAITKITASFKVLEPYYSEDPAARDKLAKLRELTEAKMSELALTIQLHDEGRDSAALDLVLSDIGKEKMEAIRQVGAELLTHQLQNVTASRSDLINTLILNRVGVAALSAISLLALLLYLRKSAALVRHQLALKQHAQMERDRLEVEVAQRTAQLTELTHHLVSAREDERNRLARNLHDDLGSLLTSAKLDAARIRSRLAGTTPETLELLSHLVGTLNSGIALGRRIIEDLRPSALSNLGLVATLEILAREFADHSGVNVQCALEPVDLDVNAELMVYRLVQEAITNITKYAQARHVWVTLSKQDNHVEVSVQDDGVGFETTKKLDSKYGLIGMRFRVEAEGGVLHVTSLPGNGTTVRAILPLVSTGTNHEPVRA
jgi:signal transduction histidine kinase